MMLPALRHAALRSAAVSFFALFLLLPTNASGVAPAPDQAATGIGGVLYAPDAPLDATVTPLYDPKRVETPYGTSHVRFRGANGQFVPGLMTVPLGAGPAAPPRKAPCILLLHGLGGSKADVLILAVALARHGYATLAIDIAGHGERPRIHGKPIEQLSIAEMHDLAATTAVDLRRAVDFLDAREEIAPDRIGFLGISLGGILGALFAGNEPRLKAVCLWAGGGDWGQLLATSQHPWAETFRKGNHIAGVASAPSVESALADVDPVSVIGRVAPRPLLFLNGTNDAIVPRRCADALFQAAREPKRRLLLPGGHIPDESLMTLQSLAFFDAMLKPAVPSGSASLPVRRPTLLPLQQRLALVEPGHAVVGIARVPLFFLTKPSI